MIIKWVILIQIQFRQLLWVLGGEKKRIEKTQMKIREKTHFDIFRTTNYDLSTSSPISQNWNILISTHLIVKLKIVLERLGSGEDIGKNPFLYSKFFTSKNPCDSSPPPRWNHETGTSEKFSKHGFSFFNPNIPISLETRTKSKIGWLFHNNPHLNSKNTFWQNFKKFSKAKCKKPNLVCQNWVLTRNTDKNFWSCHFQADTGDPRQGLIFHQREFPPHQVSSFSMHLTGVDSDTRVKICSPPSLLHFPSAPPPHFWLTVRRESARVPYRGM